MGAPMDQAAADGVVHQRSDRRFIVRRQAPKTGVGMEIRLPMDLGVVIRCGKGGSGDPAALFQTNDIYPSLSQAPSECRSGRSGADDNYVGDIIALGQYSSSF